MTTQKTIRSTDLEEGKLYRAVSATTGASVVAVKESVIVKQGIGAFFKGDEAVPLMVEYNDMTDTTDSEAVKEAGETIYLTDDWRDIPESDLAFIEIDEDGKDITEDAQP